MTDNELIERCKHGDREAFTKIMEKYQNIMFGMAYNILSDYQDAEDAVQETFIKAYKSISSFKGQSAFTTWLYVICRNACNDILRKRQKHSNVTSVDLEDSEDSSIREIKSDEPTPEECMEMSETQALVRDGINALKPEYKEVIVLSDMQELSYEEISAILKIPVGTVKSRLNRARSALRKNLSHKWELFK